MVRVNRPLLEASKRRGGSLVGFAREQLAATVPMGRPQKKTTGQARDPVASIDSIVGEAMRWEGPEDDPSKYTRHLASQNITPIPPLKSLYGLQPGEMNGWVAGHELAVSLRLVQATKPLLKPEEWEGRRVTFQPEGETNYRLEVSGPYTPLRRQPRNVPTIIGSVHSFPGEPDDRSPMYRAWKRMVVRAMLKHYGRENIVTIVEHTEERHGHIHGVIALPEPGAPIASRTAMNACRDAAAARGASKSDLGAWYRTGGRHFQNFFWKHVGKRLGWLHPRDNPDKGDRETPEETAARKRLAGEIAAIDAVQAVKKDRFVMTIKKAQERMTAIELAFGKAQAVRDAKLAKQAKEDAAAEDKRRADATAASQSLKRARDLEQAAEGAHFVAETRMKAAAAAQRALLQIVEDSKRKNQLAPGEYEDLLSSLRVVDSMLHKAKRVDKKEDA
jgi:hypothetical protein